ncbi:MAG: Phosphoenolpyruvate phosphomutase [Verrucomicrobiales bacterium]|nr:Phosphoenolpyruvate phosphomutase [Verrucomicrobiales bacterium]
MQSSTNLPNGRLSTNGATAKQTHASRLFNGKFQVGVGIYDGVSALLAAKHEFDFVWISSFCCSAAQGVPDVGIIGPEDILNLVRLSRRLTDLPIIVDLDSGYGDAVKIYHVIEAMARAGVSAVCIEDNPTSKRCSLYGGYERELASIAEHSTRLRASREAIKNTGSECRIIARTEALVAGMGMDEALKRAEAYVQNGADAVFAQSLDKSGGEILTFGKKWGGRTPYVIAPTKLPQITKQQFEASGISHTIFANQGLRAAHKAIDETFATLAAATAAQSVEGTISTVAQVAECVGAKEVADLETLLADEPSAPIVTRA